MSTKAMIDRRLTPERMDIECRTLEHILTSAHRTMDYLNYPRTSLPTKEST